MSTEKMTLEEFTGLLDRFGADAARWPAALQPPAHVLLQSSTEAKRLHREAVQLDECLDAALPDLGTEDLPRLKRRILEQIGSSLRENSAVLRFWTWLMAGPRVAHVVLVRPAALAMIPLVLGFALGLTFPESNGIDGELVTELTLLALTDRYEGFLDAQ
jgi:hypothetical protein